MATLGTVPVDRLRAEVIPAVCAGEVDGDVAAGVEDRRNASWLSIHDASSVTCVGKPSPLWTFGCRLSDIILLVEYFHGSSAPKWFTSSRTQEAPAARRPGSGRARRRNHVYILPTFLPGPTSTRREPVSGRTPTAGRFISRRGIRGERSTARCATGDAAAAPAIRWLGCCSSTAESPSGAGVKSSTAARPSGRVIRASAG